MNSGQLKALSNRFGFSQGFLADQLGKHRCTVNRWMNGKYAIPQVAEMAIKLLISSHEWRPGARRKRNRFVPPALRDRTCPGCGGVLWWPHARGIRRKGVAVKVYPARCKARTENPSACGITSVYFDAQGNQLTALPRYAPRDFKKLPFDRPLCSECCLKMRSGKTATKRVVTEKGRVCDEKVWGFYCDGDRYGKPSHRLVTTYTNSKGGPVIVARGKHRKLAELPFGLRTRYPSCCGKPMARQAKYMSKTGKRTWWFLCRTCGGQRSFNDSGKPHTPYHYGTGPRTERKCPECGRRLSRARKPKHPMLERFACRNYDLRHDKRHFYYHYRNGRRYELFGTGSRWEARPVTE